MTYISRARLVELEPAECWSFLRRNQYGVGRLAFGQSPPEILPVNYLLDGGTIVVQTGDGLILEAAKRQERVAFEVDQISLAGHAREARGWSVLIKGVLEEVVEGADRVFLRLGHLAPSAGGFRPNFVRIRIDELTGRSF